MKDPLWDRLDRWYEWATAQGRILDRILIHPDDLRQAPTEYMGLPVVVLGQK